MNSLKNILIILPLFLLANHAYAGPSFEDIERCMTSFGLSNRDNDGPYAELPISAGSPDKGSLLVVTKAGAMEVELAREIAFSNSLGAYFTPPGHTRIMRSGLNYTSQGNLESYWQGFVGIEESQRSPSKNLSVAETIATLSGKLKAYADRMLANVDQDIHYLDLVLHRTREFDQLPGLMINQEELAYRQKMLPWLKTRLDACDPINDESIKAAVAQERARLTKIEEKLAEYPSQQTKLKECLAERLSNLKRPRPGTVTGN